jgi:hypothetical protein
MSTPVVPHFRNTCMAGLVPSGRYGSGSPAYGSFEKHYAVANDQVMDETA